MTAMPKSFAQRTTASPGGLSPQQVVHFSRRPARPGDRVGQELAVQLNVQTQIVQSGQKAHEGDSTMRRRQTRLIEVLEAKDGKLHRARVIFPISRLQTPESEERELKPQPIEGKTYIVTRNGEFLNITTPDGEMPPLEEYRPAAEALEMLGRPNRLAAFLIKRPVNVGETLLVPRAIAGELMGVNDEVGIVKRFELRLLGVEAPLLEGGSPRAVFASKIETMASEASPIELTIEGRVTVETETCRTVAASLSGPVQISSVEQTRGGVYQFEASGSLRVVIRSQYGTLK